METQVMIDDSPAPVLSKLTATHLPQAVALSSEMGWPYRAEDWAFAHALGDGLALELGDRLIGTAMRWNYGNAFTSIGMIIVGKEFQGHGYGARLVDALLAGVESTTVFLNATREAFDLYQRRGFISTGVLNQHQGVPVLNGASSQQSRVRKAEASDLSLIMDLDEGCLGMPRTGLLKCLAEIGQLILISAGGVASGYAVCRAFGRGHVIGPVVAQNLEDARTLIEAAISQLSGGIVRVDTSADSGLSPWLEERGLKCVDTATPMMRGTPPQTSQQTRIFALCSQSLG